MHNSNLVISLFLLLSTQVLAFPSHLFQAKSSTFCAVKVDTFSKSSSSDSFSAKVFIQNIAYEKHVTLFYTNANETEFNPQPCTYSSRFNSTHEYWSCSTRLSLGMSWFFIKYSVQDKTYFDMGNGEGLGYHYYVDQLTKASTTQQLIATSFVTPTTTCISDQLAKTSIQRSPAATGAPSSDSGLYTLPGCSNFNGLDSCSGNGSIHLNSKGQQIDYPDSDESRKWQTPPRNTTNYVTNAFQDYSGLTGYADITYDSKRQSAVVKIITFTKSPDSIVECKFGDEAFTRSKTINVTPKSQFPLIVSCRSDSLLLELDPLYFLWNNPEINRPETQGGQKGGIVEMFGWPYTDISKECEFITPNEHVMSDQWLEPDGQFNPWYHLYQPVSYRLYSRQGTFQELRDMIVSCRSVGVRVYADAVINHMSGGGNAVNPKRNMNGGWCNNFGPKNSSFGSPYFTHSYTYQHNDNTNQRPALEFPAVPFGPTDFHCERSLSSYTDGFILSNGWLVGLTDLNTGKPYVQQRIATYLATLLSIGFSGFRIDAAKHISPTDLSKILSALSTKMGGSLPQDFITWLEVIIGGEKDLLCCEYSDYQYYTFFDDQMKSMGMSTVDIQKIKIWRLVSYLRMNSSDYPKEMPICGRWIIPSERFVIQNDDHDQQAGSNSRDMQDFGSVFLKDRDVNRHRQFNMRLFSRRDGNWKIKLVLSSFSNSETGGTGFPDGKSDCSRYKGTQNMRCVGIAYRPAYVKDACGYSVFKNGNWISGEYTRTHRDIGVINSMREWMGLGSVGARDLGIPDSCM